MIDVLIEEIGSYYFPIYTFILGVHVIDSKSYSLFKIHLNVSHIDSLDLGPLVHHVWNLLPCLVGEMGLMLWCEGCI